MKKQISLFIAIVVLLSSISIVAYASGEGLNKTKATIGVGDKLKLKVRGVTVPVTWKSNNKSVAVVSDKGVVTAKKVGGVKIIASTDSKKYVCNITVRKKTDMVAESIINSMIPVAKEYDKKQTVDNLLSIMSLEEKVGQMFYVRCPETDAVKKISQYHSGGYILFGRDFKDKSKSQVVSAINSYQSASDIPMLIGVDEEGGTVVRASSTPKLRSTPFLSPRNTYKNGGWTAIENDAKQKANLLLSLGINVNMAPVCDITSNSNAFMYDRSFGNNADSVCKFVDRYVSVTKENNLGTVLKHFPGYGNCADTHTGIAYDNRSYSQFESSDFKPFITGIEKGADCILVAHNIVKCMDKKYPASLSKKVHKIIRNELDFDGVVMTDDLSMEAIRDYTGDDTAAVFAVKAGNDVLCCTDVDVQYPAVLKAVKSGEISQKQIDKSVKRILIWKYNLGLL